MEAFALVKAPKSFLYSLQALAIKRPSKSMEQKSCKLYFKHWDEKCREHVTRTSAWSISGLLVMLKLKSSVALALQHKLASSIICDGLTSSQMINEDKRFHLILLKVKSLIFSPQSQKETNKMIICASCILTVETGVFRWLMPN